MPTREQLMQQLTEDHEVFLAHYHTFTPEELARPCTESEVPGGAPWRPKDHLAHLALIERLFRGIIQRAMKGETDPVGFSRAGLGNREEIMAWIHRNNQAYVEAHRDDDLETLLSAISAERTQTLALLEQLSDEQLKIVLPGAPWGDGTIGGVLMTNAHHEKLHLSWVDKGLQQHADHA